MSNQKKWIERIAVCAAMPWFYLILMRYSYFAIPYSFNKGPLNGTFILLTSLVGFFFLIRSSRKMLKQLKNSKSQAK